MNYIDNIISGIKGFGEKYEFLINNFKTVYILVILIYVACVFILISQYKINKKLDRVLLYDKSKSDTIEVVDNKVSKYLGGLVLVVLVVIFIIIIFSSIS